MSTETLLSLLPFLIVQIPFLMIYCVGIVLSIVRWKRHPTVSKLCLIAFSSFLLSLSIRNGQQIWIFSAIRREESARTIGTLGAAVGAVASLLTVAGWAILLPAIFGWRSPRPKE